MNPLLAEFIGTALLIILGNGVVANVVLKETKGNSSGWIVITFGWAMAVFVAVFTMGQFSGAHINPAVSIGLAAAGLFDWAMVPSFITAQVAGGFVGASLVWISYKDHFDVTEDSGGILACFSTGPAIRNTFSNFLTEMIGTFVLLFAIFYLIGPGFTNSEGKLLTSITVDGQDVGFGLGALSALPVAFLVLAIGLSLGGPTGYAINPARDFGPRMAHAILPLKHKGASDWGYAWVPIVAPVVGAILAALLFGILS